jgi:hypothetical protein
VQPRDGRPFDAVGADVHDLRGWPLIVALEAHAIKRERRLLLARLSQRLLEQLGRNLY